MFPIKVIEDRELESKWFVNAKNIKQHTYFNVISVNSMKEYLEKKHYTDADCISFLTHVISMFSNITNTNHNMAKYKRDIVRKPTYEEYDLLERHLRSNKLQYNKQKDELIQTI